MIIEAITSFIGGGLGSATAVYLVTRKHGSNNASAPAFTISQKHLKQDPRYKLAQNMLKQADAIFDEAAGMSARGSTTLAADVRQDGEDLVERATELLDKIKSDQGSYAPENFQKEAPYPTQGYGV